MGWSTSEGLQTLGCRFDGMTSYGFTTILDVGFNPFEKYESQNGNLPQVGVKIKDL